jgi:hypothetical protein
MRRDAGKSPHHELQFTMLLWVRLHFIMASESRAWGRRPFPGAIPPRLHRRTAWGVQGGRRRPQAARPVGGQAGRPPHMAVSGVAQPQGVEGSGMADPGETLGSPWPPHAICPCSNASPGAIPKAPSGMAQLSQDNNDDDVGENQSKLTFLLIHVGAYFMGCQAGSMGPQFW